MLKKTFYTFVLAYFLGTFIYSFYPLNISFLFYFSFILIIIYIVLSSFKKTPPGIFVYLIIIFLALFLSSLRFYFFNLSNQGDLDDLLNQRIERNVWVADEPEEKSYRTKLLVKIENSNSGAIM